MSFVCCEIFREEEEGEGLLISSSDGGEEANWDDENSLTSCSRALTSEITLLFLERK